MTLEEIKNELISEGKNPDDYNVEIIDGGYTATLIKKTPQEEKIESLRQSVAELTFLVSMGGV